MRMIYEFSFDFFKKVNPNLKEKQISEISLSDLSALQPVDFEEFEELKNYFQKPKGLSRKVCK